VFNSDEYRSALTLDVRAGSVQKRLHMRALCYVSFGFVLYFALGQQDFAQVVQANQSSLVRSQAPSPFGPNASPAGVEGGQAVATPNDSDLGEQQILKRVQEYDPFSFSFGVPFYWTSNVALTRNHELGDFVVAPAAALFYEPRISQTLYGFAGVRQQFFYYNEFNGFDFGSFDFEIGLRYSLPQFHNLMLRFEYDYNRLTENGTFEDFYSDNLLVANAEIPFWIGRAQQVSIGFNENISVAATPDLPRRNDYELYAGYTVNLTRALSLNAVGRFVVRDYYHQHSRVDINEILALGAYYQITRFLSAGTVATFGASQSNHSVLDYNVANVGGVATLWLRF
jgi:hypothetical protein